jgi:HK97 family phage prohead protease
MEKRDGVVVKATIVRGIAHPPGEPDTYNGLKLTKKEIMDKYKALPGTMVYDNHDLTKPIGKVILSYLNDDGALCLEAMLYDDYPHSKEVIERVKNGDYKGMSLGCKHTYNKKTGEVYNSDVSELSLCPFGALPGTDILSVASGSEGGKGEPVGYEIAWFDIGNYIEHVFTTASGGEYTQREEVRAPTDTDPYYRNSRGQFAAPLLPDIRDDVFNKPTVQGDTHFSNTF